MTWYRTPLSYNALADFPDPKTITQSLLLIMRMCAWYTQLPIRIGISTWRSKKKKNSELCDGKLELRWDLVWVRTSSPFRCFHLPLLNSFIRAMLHRQPNECDQDILHGLKQKKKKNGLQWAVRWYKFWGCWPRNGSSSQFWTSDHKLALSTVSCTWSNSAPHGHNAQILLAEDSLFRWWPHIYKKFWKQPIFEELVVRTDDGSGMKIDANILLDTIVRTYARNIATLSPRWRRTMPRDHLQVVSHFGHSGIGGCSHDRFPLALASALSWSNFFLLVSPLSEGKKTIF